MKLITRAENIAAEVAEYVARHEHIRGRGKIHRVQGFPHLKPGAALRARYDELKAAGAIGELAAKELMGYVPTLECDECESEDVDTILHIGDEPNYDARWQQLCPVCVRRAYFMVEGNK